jgi:hypothetical protein
VDGRVGASGDDGRAGVGFGPNDMPESQANIPKPTLTNNDYKAIRVFILFPAGQK